MSQVLSSDKDCMQFTGVPSINYLEGMLTIVNKQFPTIKYWKGLQSMSTKSYEKKSSRKPGRPRLLSRKEEMVITLTRLRTGCDIWFLSFTFGISQSLLSSVFMTWIPLLCTVTAPLRSWIPLELIKQHMPPGLKKDYPKTRVIIDCTEFRIQKPKNATVQATTYSTYKSNNTYKCLLGISPSGAFTFISDLFGGNCSDKYITEHSGFLDILEYGDDVMADRGFTIRGLLADRGATLNMPPFTRKCRYGKGKRLNNNEIWQTRTIAKHRIHVERAICRLKEFGLVSRTMNSSLNYVADEMIKLCAALCNMQMPLIK